MLGVTSHGCSVYTRVDIMAVQCLVNGHLASFLHSIKERHQRKDGIRFKDKEVIESVTKKESNIASSHSRHISEVAFYRVGPIWF